jgi:hypothetical protein
MPFTHTNRKGVTYTLYRKIGKDGKPRYVFGRNVVGEPVDELPPGFRVSESPNGVVSVARDRPSLLQPEEIAAVEAEVQRHPQGKELRVVSKPKQIEIYGNVGPNVVAAYHEMVAAGFVPPGREEQMRELDEQFATFSPVLRFVLIDAERRTFAAEEFSSWSGITEWLELGQTGDIAALAGAILPALSKDASPAFIEVGLPGITMQPPTAPGKGRKARSSGKRARSQPASVHQLKVTLLGLKPPIWRRIAVPSEMTLGELHYVLQLAMGWTDSHLHDFQIGNTTYGDPEMLQELGDADEWDATLADVAPRAKSRIRYMYDFGDSWEHDIQVEKVGPPEAGVRYPVVLAGARAGPPDDCGGVWGYADLLVILADPDHLEHDDMMEWAGGPIDPEAFDLEDVNERLARMP